MFWTQLKCTFPPCRPGACVQSHSHLPFSSHLRRPFTAQTRQPACFTAHHGADPPLPGDWRSHAPPSPPRRPPPPPPTPLLCQRQRVWHERCEVRARQPANNLSRRDGARSRPGSRYNGRRREEEVWRSTSTSTSPAAGLSVLTCQGFEGEMQAGQSARRTEEGSVHAPRRAAVAPP